MRIAVLLLMIVSRDRTAVPAAGLYNICYVNGFQIQPDEESFWMQQHADLILRDGGSPVIDPDGLLTEDHAVAAMKLFSDRAHAAGMAMAQKNSSEIVARKAELGTDFAVAEECNTYDECDAYTGGYGDHVIVIEYVRADYNAGCSAYPNLSIVLRDRDLVLPSSGGYVYDGC